MNDFSPAAALRQVAAGLTDALARFVPRALTGLVIVLVGVVLAWLARRLVRTAFARLKLDDLLERVGVTELLRRIGVTGSPGEALSRVVYYLLVLLFCQSAAATVGLGAVADAVAAFFGYLPSLVAAVLVLLIGVVVGRGAGNVVTTAARDAGVDFAPALGRAVTAVVVFVVAVMAVSQLRIDTDLVRAVVLVILAGFSLALALSFGLGTREITRHLVAGFYVRRLWQVGDTVAVAGEEGVVQGITPLNVLLERDGRIAAVPHAVFLEQVTRGGE